MFALIGRLGPHVELHAPAVSYSDRARAGLEHHSVELGHEAALRHPISDVLSGGRRRFGFPGGGCRGVRRARRGWSRCGGCFRRGTRGLRRNRRCRCRRSRRTRFGRFWGGRRSAAGGGKRHRRRQRKGAKRARNGGGRVHGGESTRVQPCRTPLATGRRPANTVVMGARRVAVRSDVVRHEATVLLCRFAGCTRRRTRRGSRRSVRARGHGGFLGGRRRDRRRVDRVRGGSCTAR